MIIKCLHNSQLDLPSSFLAKIGNAPNRITVNNLYIAYGMILQYDYIWYIINDDDSTYPIGYPSSFFEIIDNRLSKYWVYNFEKDENTDKPISMWTFPDWANNDDFYYNLLEDEEYATKRFHYYKELMTLEYPNSLIQIKAEKLDDNWLMCPLCIDAWQTNSIVGMVVCPKCNTQMHNPNYFEPFHDNV